MKSPKKILASLDKQIKAGTRLLAEKKRRARAAASKIEKENAALSLKTVKKAVRSLEEHQALLELQLGEKDEGPPLSAG